MLIGVTISCWIFCFYIVKPVMPILPLLTILCVREKLYWIVMISTLLQNSVLQMITT